MMATAIGSVFASGNTGTEGCVSPDEVDIIIASSAGSLDFLLEWVHVLKPYHVIVVHYGTETAAKLQHSIPAGLDCDVYTRQDVKRVLGARATCISSKDSGCRCFGWLVSRKRYVVTFTDDCMPVSTAISSSSGGCGSSGSAPAPLQGTQAKQQQQQQTLLVPAGATAATPAAMFQHGGMPVLPASSHRSPVLLHTRNLSMPSTPHHFNTLYDPYEDSTDFVRGYPFSLREGVPTAVSHGLWLNVPDYDAPTTLVKPNERNRRYVDATLTIPKGTLFPMSAINLAFDRHLVGVAMYFPPVADGQPLGFHDDMWAGWCCKVICDHLGLGVKTGLPYVWRERKANAFANLKKEYKGLFWQEEIVPFFQNLQLPKDATTAELCYAEIATQVKEKLGKVDGTFAKLADGMLMWLDTWRTLESFQSPLASSTASALQSA